MATRYALEIPGYATESLPYSPVTSPYSGKPIAEVQQLDATGMQHAVATAHALFLDRDRWLPAHERAAIFQRTADLVHEQAEELALTIAQEGAKPLADSRVEMARAENGLRLCAEECTRVAGREIPMLATPAAAGRAAFTIREPIGVVAAVSAFNHPFNLIVHQVGPALAAGCPVLDKPAPDTPISCLRLVQLLHEAGLPKEWCQAVPCDNAVAELLVTHLDLGFFTFIGSAKVGWMLRSKLAPGVRCALEHGGTAPAVVDRDADLEQIVPLLVKGGMYHAGQVCVSVQRVFVHRSRRKELINALTEKIAALKVGDPSLAETEVGPLIRAGEVARVHEWVEEAVAGGAQCVLGGKPLDNQCYAPTLLVDPPADSKVMQQEIFGPVICVRSFEELDEAIGMANDVPWSFQAAYFGQDVDRAWRAARRIKGAAVMINDHTAFRVDWMPFAGRGPSGLGVGGIEPQILEMTEEKLVVWKLRNP